MTNSLAIILTCFNRKEKTLSCLSMLKKQKDINNIEIHIFLVDDASTDGTGSAVRKHFPEVNILKGDGQLYWNGGMHLAFKEAIKKDFDYYLWLNDDVTLYRNAISKLLETEESLYKLNNKASIVIGSMQDSISGKVTYGGNIKKGWYAPLSYTRIEPCNRPVECDAINGNCVLIPKEVVRKVGNLSTQFTHGAGDYDYSLRAKKIGLKSYVASGFYGTCSQNDIVGTCRDRSVSFKYRKKMLQRPTSLVSAKEWMIFAKRHGGIVFPIYWIRTSIRILFPNIWLLFRSK